MANSGAPVKVVQKLARHADFQLTYDIYARTIDGTEVKALDALPDLPNIGNFCFTSCFTSNTQQNTIKDNKAPEKSLVFGQKRRFWDDREYPKGLEPLGEKQQVQENKELTADKQFYYATSFATSLSKSAENTPEQNTQEPLENYHAKVSLISDICELLKQADVEYLHELKQRLENGGK